MLTHQLFRILKVVVAAGLCWLLVRQMGPWPAFAVWAAATAVACAVSAAVLRTAKLGEMSWKNRQAGYILAWGYGLSGGLLGRIAVVSWAVWVLIGLGVALQARPGGSAAPGAVGASALGVWSWLLFAAWAIDAAALIYLLGVVVKDYSPSSSSGRNLLTLAGILGLMIAGSAALHLAGYTRTAVLIAGGLPAVLGAAYGLFVVVLLTAGRNARWN